MKFYQEITLLPSLGDEAPLTFIWAKLYQQLHLAFVECVDKKGKINIGVSFPNYQSGNEGRYLGDKLRIFAKSEEALELLYLTKWLSRLSDYTHLSNTRKVPDEIEGYAFFSRLIEKGSNEKLARRRAKRLGIEYEEALAFFRDKTKRPQPKRNAHLYPFISMRSLGTDDGSNKYPVTIVRTETDSLVLDKGFSTYGLSSDSSVPIF